MLIKVVKFILTILLFAGFFHLSSVAANDWQADFYKDHVLVGKIWDTHKQTWLTDHQFYKELLYYDYILLGEVHNHPDHHYLQSKVLESLVKSGAQPTVVMEMLSIEGWKEQPLTWKKLPELLELVAMINEGWPWELYTPVLNSVVQHQLRLHAGNIGSEELHQWANDQKFEDDNLAKSEYSYTQDEINLLNKNIIDSHCGHANEGFVKFMSRAQMHRDHVMANALLNKPLPVVFIAGSGHVRNDYAVPMQLRRKYNQTSYLSVSYISVQEELQEPQEYFQDRHHLYDVLYFTPSHTNEDPCVKFRKQLKSMQHRQTP